MSVSTTLIVLGKQPYRESALLLRGISPDCGRLSLVAHGAQSLAPKSFPAADLFRELEVEYRPSDQSTLFNADKLELLAEFDGIAQDRRFFAFALRIGSFLLKNLAEDLAQPYTYDTLRGILSRLADPGSAGEPWTLEQCAVVFKTTFLYENGQLPEGGNARQTAFLESLVEAGVAGSGLPECRPEYWKQLNGWLDSLIAYHQLQR